MRGGVEKTSVLVIFLVCAASGLFAKSIENWPAPATWSPAKSHAVSAMDVTNPLPFIGLAPCRIVDTRGNGAPITGGMFSGGSDVRSYALSGICGIPASARAVSLNFTVTGPTAPGFLTAWPTGGAVPPVSILNFAAGQQIANAAVVPTSASTSITVNVSAPTHVIVDVNGYYASTTLTNALAPGEQFTLFGDLAGLGTGLLVVRNNEAAAAARAGYFLCDSAGTGSTGLAGFATAPTGLTAGIYAQASSSTDGSAGLSGVETATTGQVYGVKGITFSTVAGAAGVYGVDGSGDPALTLPESVGVRGAATNGIGVYGGGFNGVIGVSNGAYGVQGLHVGTSGATETYGVLGFDSQYGVFANGRIGATGTKSFIEPHPTDPTKEIAYVALEGPEAGTYFRGRGSLHNGVSVISVPESFRLVSDEEGLTVQVTPIGQVANVAVVSVDLNTIVVRSSVTELEFYYLVNGVRKAFNEWNAIIENKHYVPEGPTARMPAAFAPEQRRALIATGVYNADGTVNMETAERLGWAKAWRAREEQGNATAAANAAAHAARLTETK